MIKLRNACLDERTDGYGKKQIILRGTILPETLEAIQIDVYQRKEHTPKTLSSIINGFRTASPFLDIALGMRGENFRDLTSDTIELLDETYAVDGYHRVMGAIIVMKKWPEVSINLGAQVFFNTTVDVERDWFRVWNTTSKGVAPSVILRNEKDRSHLAATLYGVSTCQQDFALYKRVAWDDRPVKKDGIDQLVRGITLLKIAHLLHMHKFGRVQTSGGWANALEALRRIEAKVGQVGLSNIRQNLITFFATVETCWPFRDLSKNASRSQLREAFLIMLARLFSDHEVFWKQPDEVELKVPSKIIHDLRRLNLEDPEIAQLLHRGRHGTDILYSTIVKRLNHGRSTHRLVDRWQTGRVGGEDDDAEAA